MNLTYEPVFSPSNFWFGEHALLTLIMVGVLVVSFLVVSLVMLWAPSLPFPNRRGEDDAPKQTPKQKKGKKKR